VLAFLRRERPKLAAHADGAAIVRTGNDLIPQVVDAARRLDASYLFIQGPPGAGKTFTGSHLIVALLQSGFRVGVSSNSHKAINNLLKAVEERGCGAGHRLHRLEEVQRQRPRQPFRWQADSR
jgi:hypothetical protein